MGDSPKAEVIRLDDYRPHIEGPAKCLACKNEWYAIAPAGVYEFECPVCGTMKGVMQYLVEASVQWICGCGNHLFALTPDGALCPNCGAWQTWPE